MLQGILFPLTQMPKGDSMKDFIDQYRRFRHLVREDIGDLEELDIMTLFCVWVENKPVIQNPFAGLETFFKGYQDIFQNNNANEDPDDENNNDDPFHNSSR